MCSAQRCDQTVLGYLNRSPGKKTVEVPHAVEFTVYRETRRRVSIEPRSEAPRSPRQEAIRGQDRIREGVSKKSGWQGTISGGKVDSEISEVNGEAIRGVDERNRKSRSNIEGREVFSKSRSSAKTVSGRRTRGQGADPTLIPTLRETEW
jgi:hypothetical protein